MVQTLENQNSEGQVPFGEPIINRESPSSPLDNAVLAPISVARRIGYGGITIPTGGPDEGTTNASSDTESLRTTLGVEQPEGSARSPIQPSENQHPLHTEEELDGDQSTESQACFEQVSSLCANTNQACSERAASLPMDLQVEPPALHKQSPYGDSHGSEPAEAALPSQGQEPTVLLAPSAFPEV